MDIGVSPDQKKTDTSWMLKLEDAFYYFHCCGWKQHLSRSKMQEHLGIDCASEKLRFLSHHKPLMMHVWIDE